MGTITHNYNINMLEAIALSSTLFGSVYLFGLSLSELNKLNLNTQIRPNYWARILNYMVFFASGSIFIRCGLKSCKLLKS